MANKKQPKTSPAQRILADIFGSLKVIEKACKFWASIELDMKVDLSEENRKLRVENHKLTKKFQESQREQFRLIQKTVDIENLHKNSELNKNVWFNKCEKLEKENKNIREMLNEVSNLYWQECSISNGLKKTIGKMKKSIKVAINE